MPDLSEMRTAIAAALQGIPGVQALPYMVSNPTPPSVWVFPDEIDYDAVMGRGHDDWFFSVQAIVGLSTDQGAQMRLDRMLAPSGEESVKAVLEVDKTLGGVAYDLDVQSCSGYRVYPRESGGPVLGAEWRVHVMADGR